MESHFSCRLISSAGLRPFDSFTYWEVAKVMNDYFMELRPSRRPPPAAMTSEYIELPPAKRPQLQK